MLYSKKGMIATLMASVILSILFTNCQKTLDTGTAVKASTSVPGGSNPQVNEVCTMAPSGLRDPRTIDAVVDLVNALPKPLSLNCLLKNLPTPFQVIATSSKNSFQPAVNADTPRIFIFKSNLMFSVVPGGAAKEALELSQVVTSNLSVKGEIYFPVTANIPNDTPYTRVLLAGVSGTSCQLCHRNESPVLFGFRGNAFASEILEPDPITLVPANRLKYLSSICDGDADQFRCRMLKTIYTDGAAVDIAFPF